MVADPAIEPARFAQTYFVPRGGTAVPETVHDRDGLRAVRTELELLRRIRRRAATQDPRAGSATSSRFSPEDREELTQIINDARHPIVDEMVRLIDRDFCDLRKEILMSVVNEQAENIVQDAVESGAVEAAGQAPELVEPSPVQKSADAVTAPPASEETNAESVEAVVTTTPVGKAAPVTDTAETEVHAESAETTAPGSDAVSVAGASASETPTEEVAAEVEVEASSVAEEDAGSPDVTVAPTGDALADAEAKLARVAELDDAANGDGAEECEPAPADAVLAADQAKSTPNSTEVPSADHTPEGAVRAVTEIEKGIRQLASLLSAEVGEQWRQARETFEHVETARERTEEAERKAASMLKQITRLREETQSARNDVEAAREEARTLRKEARIAKERANSSADAAEAAADQACQEARQARKRACRS